MSEANKSFLFEYEHNGAKWAFHIYADDVDDARARLRKIAHAKYLGSDVTKIPLVPGAGLFVRAWCVVANFFRTKGA